LAGVLRKAAAHVEAHKLEPASLLTARLYPDMFDFTRQVQVGTDFARAAVARLQGRPPEPDKTEDHSFADLSARVDRALAELREVTPAQIDGSEERAIAMRLGGKDVELTGQQYLLGFLLPNFYFHLTTAYAILRHNGVEIGKRDFLGPVI
jgi:hypothetical protein